mmetsp:Transcript_7768/g.8879  ORF Transcript_7768/g.8879 Transcript_7768/m.8879 type:complete len:242 (-) Transcript_7768:581-1306(-)
MERPDCKTLSFKAATSSSLIGGPAASGTGSCHGCGGGTNEPRQRACGPMSRWVSLYHALPQASSKSFGFSWKRCAIGAYTGSILRARSVVNMTGACFLLGLCASGTRLAAAGSVGIHSWAPAGLLTSLNSYLNRFSKNPWSHWAGLLVHAPSRPLVMVCSPLPLPKLFFQPKPCSSMGAASGAGPTCASGSAAPWPFPNVCPPAISATVSSSFIAMRANVSRISLAAASGSGLPSGPSGFT